MIFHDIQFLYSWPFTMAAAVLGCAFFLLYLFRFWERESLLLASAHALISGIILGISFWFPSWAFIKLWALIFGGIPEMVRLSYFYFLYGFLSLSLIVALATLVKKEE